jgi:uncharacterized protein YabN with tetrapyrrole methylase and pyrophosphatase domain
MQEKSALGRAVAMVKDLRERCSWDRVQTRDTLRPYLIEEAHELERALGGNDPVAIRHEVADLIRRRSVRVGRFPGCPRRCPSC